jgi:hypothetical protein
MTNSNYIQPYPSEQAQFCVFLGTTVRDTHGNLCQSPEARFGGVSSTDRKAPNQGVRSNFPNWLERAFLLVDYFC